MRAFSVVTFFMLSASLLYADGGRLQLHQQTGPFVVSLFTTPDPLTTDMADFSVAVERTGELGIVQDAEITLVLTDVNHPEERLVKQANHQQATSRFLEAANFSFPHSGMWHVLVIVHEGADVATCSANIIVQPRPVYQDRVWTMIALLPLALLMFVLHQRVKRRHAAQLAAVHQLASGR